MSNLRALCIVHSLFSAIIDVFEMIKAHSDEHHLLACRNIHINKYYDEGHDMKVMTTSKILDLGPHT